MVVLVLVPLSSSSLSSILVTIFPSLSVVISTFVFSFSALSSLLSIVAVVLSLDVLLSTSSSSSPPPLTPTSVLPSVLSSGISMAISSLPSPPSTTIFPLSLGVTDTISSPEPASTVTLPAGCDASISVKLSSACTLNVCTINILINKKIIAMIFIKPLIVFSSTELFFMSRLLRFKIIIVRLKQILITVI